MWVRLVLLNGTYYNLVHVSGMWIWDRRLQDEFWDSQCRITQVIRLFSEQDTITAKLAPPCRVLCLNDTCQAPTVFLRSATFFWWESLGLLPHTTEGAFPLTVVGPLATLLIYNSESLQLILVFSRFSALMKLIRAHCSLACTGSVMENS